MSSYFEGLIVASSKPEMLLLLKERTFNCSLQIQMHCGIFESTILGYNNAHYIFGHYFKMAAPSYSALYRV